METILDQLFSGCALQQTTNSKAAAGAVQSDVNVCFWGKLLGSWF